MRNLLLSVSFLILSGGVCAAQSQPGNPYAPGSFNNDTLIYQGIISNDADAYLGQLKAKQQQQFILPAPVQAAPGVDWNEFWAERHRAQTRAIEADTARLQRQIDRDLAEIRHMELLDAIERRR